MKTYNEMITLPTFEERLKYLQTNGIVGHDTFGAYRWMCQELYHGTMWKRLRDKIIVRDEAFDLAIDGLEIRSKIIIHHIEPITIIDIKNKTQKLLDPNNLVCVSVLTHNNIHYGNDTIDTMLDCVRKPNDTSPWLN